MLKFSTTFPIMENTSIEEFLKIPRTWIIGSPHSRITYDDLSIYEDKEEWKYNNESETISFIKVKTDIYESSGIKYEKIESDLRWITNIIATKNNNNNFCVSIQVSCDASNPSVKIPEPKKPYIIKQILESIGGGLDGVLEVKDTPHYLAESDLDIAKSLIQGSIGVKLPVIYISVNFDNGYFVDVEKLANWFSGMAHIVVEPSRNFSLALKEKVSSVNAYGGAIAIYWPDGVGRKIILPNKFNYDIKGIEIEISKQLRSGLNSVRLAQECIWSNLKELSAQKRLESLKKAGSTEIDKYIEAFDDELNAKKEALENANKEIIRLRELLKSLESKKTSGYGESLLYKGHEREFYSGEHADIIISILEKEKENIQNGTRREHIVEDILSSNKMVGNGNEIFNSIKSQLKDYKKMDRRVRQLLEEKGFKITEDGKHYKAVFHNDKRYIISFPKTSSDHKVGRNLISQIKNLLF